MGRFFRKNLIGGLHKSLSVVHRRLSEEKNENRHYPPQRRRASCPAKARRLRRLCEAASSLQALGGVLPSSQRTHVATPIP